MLAVVIDRKVKEINEYLGFSSCYGLSLLSCDFSEFQIKELKSIGVSEIVFFGKNEGLEIENVRIIEEKSELINYIEKSKDKNIILTLSNIFFEFKNSIVDFDLSSVSFTDEIGENCCVMINKQVFLDNFKNISENDDFLSVFFSNSNTEIRCAQTAFHIESIKDYKMLINMILDGKTNILLPTVASGVYASGKIPEGNFVIIPPVFFGDNVQVESDCVIGPHTVIQDNSLISKNSYIKASVLLKDNYISSNCFLDNSICCENVSVRRGSAVFDGSVLGKSVTVAESVFIENNSYIRPFTNVSEYKNKVINYKTNESLSGFCGYSPEKAALLGGAVGSVYNGAKIGILCSGKTNAEVLKYAVVSGLMSTGVQCFDFGYGFVCALQYYINYCELDYGVFISGTENGTVISVINKKSLSLPKDDYYSVKERMLKSNIKRCEKNECKSIRQIKGMKKMYIHNLVKNIRNELNVFPVFNCPNKAIEDIVHSAFLKLKCGEVNKKITFGVNESGTVCECVFEGRKYSHTKLCDFVSFYDKSYSLYDTDFWRNDAVYLCFKTLEILSEFKLDFATEIENIPSFYLAEKVIETKRKLPYVASRLSDNLKVSFANNELSVDDRDLRLKIMENGNHNKIKVLARSYRAEIANELASDLEKLLLSLDM